MIKQSLWRAVDLPVPRSGPLPKEVDVVVIGGGMTGLTAAHLLKQSGRRVAVFERETIGAGETGNTSGHLTCITDLGLSQAVRQFGKAAAQLVWAGHAAAIDFIESNNRQGMACRFQRVPAFQCAPFVGDPDLDKEAGDLRETAALAQDLGLPVRFVEDGPITGRPAISASDQAIFHPLEYAAGLAIAIDGDGSVVRGHSEVGAVIEDPLAVIVNGETIACRDIIVATHVPLVGIRGLMAATLFQTKLYPYSSYVLGAHIDDSSIMPGLYFDTSDPYYYLRVQDWPGKRYAVFGGADHKTGQESDTEACFAIVEKTLNQFIPSAKVERRWSGQVIQTADGLPYIGQVAEHQYIATGYNGNGLTFATLAGMMLCDTIAGVPNPWCDLLDPHRKVSSVEAMGTVISENVDYVRYLVADRFHGRDGSGVENVPRGSGKVITLDRQRVAVHRRDNGDVVKVSAVCTHMGCLVRWNDAERTWDCPCHGSRFTPDGLVLGGPAEAPLKKIDEA